MIKSKELRVQIFLLLLYYINCKKCGDGNESILHHVLALPHYIKLEVSQLIDCIENCKDDTRCQSYNYNLNARECFLLDVNRHSEKVPLVKKPMWVHSDNFWHACVVQRKSCNIRPCSFQAMEEANRKGGLCNPAKSCQEISQKNSSAVSGPYWIKTDSEGNKSLIYCHMEPIEACRNIVGWTLVMKLSGFKTTFSYSSLYWSNKETYHHEASASGLDNEETKPATYWSTPFDHICLGMNVSGDLQWIGLQATASSLYSLVGSGEYVEFSKGREAWKDLISESSLQKRCNKEGINVRCGKMKARFGILGNNENSCKSCDSRLGFGTAGSICKNSIKGDNSCGNEAGCYYADNGQKHVRAVGYILVH